MSCGETRELGAVASPYVLGESDLTQWDAFVDQSEHGGVYQTSQWKQVLEGSFPHIKGYFLALPDREGQRIVGGLPVYRVSSRLLGNRWVSVPFASVCDPLVGCPEDMERLLGLTKELCRAQGDSRIEIRTCFNQHALLPCGLYRSDAFYHHYLALEKGPDKLFEAFHKKAIGTPIRSLDHSPLRLRAGHDNADIKTFYRLYFETRRRLRLPPIPSRFFRLLWQHLAPKHLRMFFAELNGRPVAGMILLTYRDTAIVEDLVDDHENRQYYPNHLLYWETLKLCCAEGYKMYSFGRTHRSNLGLQVYKDRWGTSRSVMPVFFQPETAGEDRESGRLYSAIRTLSGISPSIIFRGIGAFCYRHLG